ncbi:hypothetical protein B0H15DRAFT_817333 [Mycena belliarum]|uniref:Uncharacterized protein n=1 Tax=Mycena belliarum TaxID=1033014 RepID=A0AAD6UGS0_9AGAR|nr:hypothetical protein B0H15DRAFT_817333 [Mycena belliae]
MWTQSSRRLVVIHGVTCSIFVGTSPAHRTMITLHRALACYRAGEVPAPTALQTGRREGGTSLQPCGTWDLPRATLKAALPRSCTTPRVPSYVP